MYSPTRRHGVTGIPSSFLVFSHSSLFPSPSSRRISHPRSSYLDQPLLSLALLFPLLLPQFSLLQLITQHLPPRRKPYQLALFQNQPPSPFPVGNYLRPRPSNPDGQAACTHCRAVLLFSAKRRKRARQRWHPKTKTPTRPWAVCPPSQAPAS